MYNYESKEKKPNQLTYKGKHAVAKAVYVFS